MMKRMGLILVAVAAVVAVNASSAEAGLLKAVLAGVQGANPVRPGDGVGVERQGNILLVSSTTGGCAAPVAVPCAPAPCVCCPTPCIKYRNALLDLGRLCRDKCCKPPVKLVLATKNPCTCCPVDVPVCLPGCCCGEPTVDCRKTLVGEGLVTYKWCCGVSVSIRYKKCGEVLVTYRGV